MLLSVFKCIGFDSRRDHFSTFIKIQRGSKNPFFVPLKQVLDKLNLENRTLTKITERERIETRLWNPIAMREAIINSFVHNDYTREIAPKFEIFDDRLEITSYGSLPEGLSQNEFFEGFSVPRNKELMRIFKDLDLVEQMGSGVPRILQAYKADCFQFSENFLRITLPSAGSVARSTQDTTQDAMQVTMQIKQLLNALDGIQNRTEIQKKLGLLNRENFRKTYLQPAIELDLIALTIPDKPTSGNQQYYLTEKGKALVKLEKKSD